MTTSALFISFSSEDQSFVRELMAGLKLQNLDFWDYSNELEKLRVGSNLQDSLKEKILHCTYFIAVISQNSVDREIGKWTRLELDFALSLGFLEGHDGRKIIPIVMKDNRPSKLIGSFEKLQDTIYLEITLKDDYNYHTSLDAVCKQLNCKYDPLDEAHPRLPFWKFFRDEVYYLSHAASSHIQLMVILGQFNQHFKHENWQQAYFLISYFISTCQYLISDIEIFYPLIVKAVCERHLNKLYAAEKSYLQADKVRPNNENVLGGLGGVYRQMGDLQRAKKMLERALIECPPGMNSDEKINLTIVLIELNEKIPAELISFFLNLNPQEYKQDSFKILNTQGILYYLQKNFDRSDQIFKELENDGSADTATVSYHYLCKKEFDPNQEILNYLFKMIKLADKTGKINKTRIYLYIADTYLEMGETGKALKIYENNLLNSVNVDRYILIRYARIQNHLMNSTEVQKICHRILSEYFFPPPKTHSDFYYDGFAQYLLGNEERAKYDFERSNNFDQYYKNL